MESDTPPYIVHVHCEQLYWPFYIMNHLYSVCLITMIKIVIMYFYITFSFNSNHDLILMVTKKAPGAGGPCGN